MAIGNESDEMIGKKITCGKQSVMEKYTKKWVHDLTIAHAVDLPKLCKKTSGEPTFMGPLQVWPIVYILYISINLSSIMKQYGGNASQMFIAN